MVYDIEILKKRLNSLDISQLYDLLKQSEKENNLEIANLIIITIENYHRNRIYIPNQKNNKNLFELPKIKSNPNLKIDTDLISIDNLVDILPCNQNEPKKSVKTKNSFKKTVKFITSKKKNSFNKSKESQLLSFYRKYDIKLVGCGDNLELLLTERLTCIDIVNNCFGRLGKNKKISKETKEKYKCTVLARNYKDVKGYINTNQEIFNYFYTFTFDLKKVKEIFLNNQLKGLNNIFKQQNLIYDVNSIDLTNVKQANYIFSLFFDRLRTYLKSIGFEDGLKYLYVIGKQKNNKIHYHMVINTPFISYQELKNIWKYGNSNSKEIDKNQLSFSKITKYMIKHVQEIKDTLGNCKAYNTSKSLPKKDFELRTKQAVLKYFNKNNVSLKPFFDFQKELLIKDKKDLILLLQKIYKFDNKTLNSDNWNNNKELSKFIKYLSIYDDNPKQNIPLYNRIIKINSEIEKINNMNFDNDDKIKHHYRLKNYNDYLGYFEKIFIKK